MVWCKKTIEKERKNQEKKACVFYSVTAEVVISNYFKPILAQIWIVKIDILGLNSASSFIEGIQELNLDIASWVLWLGIYFLTSSSVLRLRTYSLYVFDFLPFSLLINNLKMRLRLYLLLVSLLRQKDIPNHENRDKLVSFLLKESYNFWQFCCSDWIWRSSWIE